jgi:diguanylate cyclase (GGDEF)-like protein
MHGLGFVLKEIEKWSWEGLARFMERLSPVGLVIMGVTLNLICGMLDYVTGYEASFSIFYLVPVFFLAWFGNTGSALLMCLVSAITWLLADHLADHEYSFHWILIWNAGVRMAFFMVVALALSKIKLMNAELEELTRTDSLTGALNWRGFAEVAQKELYRSQRFRHPLSLVYVDLDNFKEVNDSLGHQEGDRVLGEVVDTIKHGIRPTDAVARLGGDEFLVLLTEIQAVEAEQVVTRFRETLLDTFRQHQWPVTLSAGVASFENEFPGSVDEMVQYADHLMYAAKQSGKDKVVAELVHSVQH